MGAARRFGADRHAALLTLFDSEGSMPRAEPQSWAWDRLGAAARACNRRGWPRGKRSTAGRAGNGRRLAARELIDGRLGEESSMSDGCEISGHYTSGDLLARLEARLREDGLDPAHATFEALALYDHLHGRGLEATEDMAGQLRVAGTDHILDVGSALGGPARYLARRFGCRVSGIDLTAEFCDVARHLTALLGLEDRVSVSQGDALAMPFGEAAFDGAYSMNVSMNIADKRALYRAIHRVIKPGAWLMLSEVAQGPGRRAGFPGRHGRGPPRRAFSRPWPRPARTSWPPASPSRACVRRRRPRSPMAPALAPRSRPAESHCTVPSR